MWDSVARAHNELVMEGRRLFEIIVVVVGLAILFGTLTWAWLALSTL